MKYRLSKLEEVLKREISKSLYSFDDSVSSCVSITMVKLSPDKKFLKVYWYSATQSKKELSFISKKLEKLTKSFRFELGNKIRSLPPPKISFKFDTSVNTIFETYKAEKILKSERVSKKI